MIILIMLLGLSLRLISINQSLWLDEATSALTTKMSLSNFFLEFTPGDFHPPLYYLVLRVWSMFFGTSEIALRSLSVLFSIATIYLVYLIGRELINKKAGIIASLLLATSGLHIYYSQEARMYSMSAFLVTLLIYFFTKTFHKSRVGDWVGYGIVIGLIGITDYLPLLILIPIWIFAVSLKKDFKWWKKFIMSHIILVILAILWAPTFTKQLTSGINITSTSQAWVAVLGTFSIKDILLIPIKFAIGRVGFDNKFIYAGIVGLLFIIFGFLIYKSKNYFEKLKLTYLWLIVPILVALIISFKIPILNYFRFLFLLPAFYLLIASGIFSLKKSSRQIFLSLIILINLTTSGIYLTNIKFQRENWKGAVSYIESNKVVNSAVIFPANSQMEVYRYYAPEATINDSKEIKNNYSEIWLVRYAVAISDPNDTTRLKVEGLGYKKAQELDFNGVVVWKYNKPIHENSN